jgi:hypothetical protein
MKTTLFFSFLLLNTLCSFAQSARLTVLPQIKLPHDSLTKHKLLNSLDVFLKEKNQDLLDSKVVEPAHYAKFSFFFDFFKNVEKSERYKDTLFFKCYLKNVVLQPDKSYKIALSYYGISPQKEVINRLDIWMLAKEGNEFFTFYCPFEANTKDWKNKKIGNVSFFYEKKFNAKVAKDFDEYSTFLAKQLNVKPLQMTYYKFTNIQEAYKSFGIEYSLSRNGDTRGWLVNEKSNIVLSGTNSEQYKHDLTHWYFGLVRPDSLQNWTAEEGYNIYKTDYWGESSEQNFQYLKDFIAANPNVSLLDAFEKNLILHHPIQIKYPIAAVLMRKIDKEYGFAKVVEMASCGESDAAFFATLQKITGITKENFDKTVRMELDK